jgi:DNA invertase Pin-like site-specific DNA recombinase
MKSILGYARVSTSEQAASGDSLEAQKTKLGAFAIATGRLLREIVVDAGESAKDLRRPGLSRIMKAVELDLVDSILIFKLDRLTRSVRDLAELLLQFARHNVTIVSVCESLDTGTAAGRLTLNLLVSVSQWEREAIGERTAFVLEHKRAKGEVYGHPPFGFYRCGNKLLHNRQELWALEIALRMRDDGVSYRRIGEWLSENGFTPHQGGSSWGAKAVAQVLGSRMTCHWLSRRGEPASDQTAAVASIENSDSDTRAARALAKNS